MADSPKTGNQEFGDLLREAREDRGMSRRDLAEATSLSYPYISQLETGYRMPSPAAIQTLSRVLGVSLDAIFAAITGPAAPPPQPTISARAAPAGWVQNSSYNSGRAVAPPAAGGSARPAAAGGAIAAGSSAAGGSAGPAAAARAESYQQRPGPLLPSAPAPSGSTSTGPAVQDTMFGGVSAVVDILLGLPTDQRLAALAEIQAQIVDSVVADRLEQNRHH